VYYNDISYYIIVCIFESSCKAACNFFSNEFILFLADGSFLETSGVLEPELFLELFLELLVELFLELFVELFLELFVELFLELFLESLSDPLFEPSSESLSDSFFKPSSESLSDSFFETFELLDSLSEKLYMLCEDLEDLEETELEEDFELTELVGEGGLSFFFDVFLDDFLSSGSSTLISRR